MKKITPEAYAANVKLNIAEHGYHVTSVVGAESSFTYSTGIFETYAIPELFISGLPPGMSGELMQSYIQRFASSGPPIGTRIRKRKPEPFGYYLIPVNRAKLKDYALASFKYYGSKPFESLQLVYPDTDLLFPHEHGYDYDQKIIGDYSVIRT